VMKGAIGVFAAAALFAGIGAATSTFSDLWVWMVVAAIHALAALWGVRRSRVRPEAAPEATS
jgi:membrane protein implicated in regulation of membrane protease activity